MITGRKSPFLDTTIRRAAAMVSGFTLGVISAAAQVVPTAYDVASNYTSGFNGNQGFGFGSWTLNTPGGGGYISGDTPRLFGLWNSAANAASTAVRPFNSILSV